ncbi:MAG: OadG family protein [Clostridiales bacterium]|nr:OadG family protein [Clostridiales bacterium]
MREIIGMNLGDGILTAVTGILLVFLVLVLLVFVVAGFRSLDEKLAALIGKKNLSEDLPEAEKKEAVAAVERLSIDGDGENKRIAAAIAAAVALATETTGNSGRARFIIRDIRRLN